MHLRDLHTLRRLIRHGQDMKRAGLWAAIVIGIYITVGLITVEPGYAEEKENEPTCTLKTLKGRYLFALHGTLLPPAFGVTEPTPSDAAGFQWRRHGERHRDIPPRRRNRAGE